MTETDLQLFAMTDPDLEPFLPGRIQTLTT